MSALYLTVERVWCQGRRLIQLPHTHCTHTHYIVSLSSKPNTLLLAAGNSLATRYMPITSHRSQDNWTTSEDIMEYGDNNVRVP